METGMWPGMLLVTYFASKAGFGWEQGAFWELEAPHLLCSSLDSGGS